MSVPVGKPPFELVPYGGYKAKNGTRENTWDESDEEGSQEPEDEVIPKVCSALLGFISIPQCLPTLNIFPPALVFSPCALTLPLTSNEEAQSTCQQSTSKWIQWV